MWHEYSGRLIFTCIPWDTWFGYMLGLTYGGAGPVPTIHNQCRLAVVMMWAVLSSNILQLKLNSIYILSVVSVFLCEHGVIVHYNYTNLQKLHL